ncbi:hypothetical protein GJQ54_05250 [Oceanospirillaceae bacterium ASx5O]|nr:hypothetical protein GJQ54_05250 [Oceanospirillaceae bacterium ASx5O]
MSAEKIIWNGCDEYVLFEDALNDPDLRKKIEGETLYTTTEKHEAIRVAEVDPELDDDGAPVESDVYTVSTRTGYKHFREIQ